MNLPGEELVLLFTTYRHAEEVNVEFPIKIMQLVVRLSVSLSGSGNDRRRDI